MEKTQFLISFDQNTIICSRGEEKFELKFVTHTNTCYACDLHTIFGKCFMPCESGERKDYTKGCFQCSDTNTKKFKKFKKSIDVTNVSIMNRFEFEKDSEKSSKDTLKNEFNFYIKFKSDFKLNAIEIKQIQEALMYIFQQDSLTDKIKEKFPEIFGDKEALTMIITHE